MWLLFINHPGPLDVEQPSGAASPKSLHVSPSRGDEKADFIFFEPILLTCHIIRVYELPLLNMTAFLGPCLDVTASLKLISQFPIPCDPSWNLEDIDEVAGASVALDATNISSAMRSDLVRHKDILARFHPRLCVHDDGVR